MRHYLQHYKANEKARESMLPICVEEDFNLYQIQADRDKKFIRKMDEPAIRLQNNKLK
jgi:hypothetical protein